MIADWIRERRDAISSELYPIELSASRDWSLSDGVIRHRLGAFFSIVAVEYEDGERAARRFPLIDQPEVGILGFCVARNMGAPQWLLQAKAEPGTTGRVQVGPTVQATKSNYLRRHGGQATLHLEHFLLPDRSGPIGLAQSEQGTRFLGKYNNNSIVMLDESFAPGGANWRWFDTADLRRALGQDFLINTDARSVIVSGDWSLLRADGPIFAGDCELAVPDGLRASLGGSLAAPSEPSLTRAIERLLAARSDQRAVLRRIPVESLPGWQGASGSTAATGIDAGIACFKVVMQGREVEEWDQPFLTSQREHIARLMLADVNGIKCALLRLSAEPGFREGVQYGPTVQTDVPCSPPLEALAETMDDAPVLSARQSDEGGRFMQVITDYAIHDLGQSRLGSDLCALPDIVAVPLSALAALCATSGMTTNELRSAVSVLLALA